jgi:aminodeoxyfutalosine deaminase
LYFLRSNETWLLIGDQNDVALERKKYKQAMRLLDKSEPNRIKDLIAALSEWVRYPEDLSRIAYDVGLQLAKDNVRYAEVCVDTGLFSASSMSLDNIMDALNDGSDRVRRGWNVEIKWILVVPREEPRRADETVRSAASATGRKNNIIGFGLIGQEDAQPIGQFERAFQTAKKKDVFTFVRVGDVLRGDGILTVLDHLEPDRLVDVLGLQQDDTLIKRLIEEQMPIILTPSRTKHLKLLKSSETLSARVLIDDGLLVSISADMLTYYGKTLSDILIALAEEEGFTHQDIEELILNTLRYSLLEDAARDVLIAEFEQQFEVLREEHLELS